MSRVARALVACALVGCGSSGGANGAPSDGGAGDATTAGDDSSTNDAGGASDAAPIEPAQACSDSIADVYVTPSGLPAMDAGARGDVVRCAVDTTIAPSDVASRLASAGVTGVDVASGVHTWRVAYRTKRATGADGGVSLKSLGSD